MPHYRHHGGYAIHVRHADRATVQVEPGDITELEGDVSPVHGTEYEDGRGTETGGWELVDDDEAAAWYEDRAKAAETASVMAEPAHTPEETSTEETSTEDATEDQASEQSDAGEQDGA